MNLLQNRPIPCRSCGRNTFGIESPVRKPDGSLVMECNWRCSQCGSFIRTGITRIVEPAK